MENRLTDERVLRYVLKKLSENPLPVRLKKPSFGSEPKGTYGNAKQASAESKKRRRRKLSQIKRARNNSR